mgnify:CR=1 FL=1
MPINWRNSPGYAQSTFHQQEKEKICARSRGIGDYRRFFTLWQSRWFRFPQTERREIRYSGSIIWREWQKGRINSRRWSVSPVDWWISCTECWKITQNTGNRSNNGCRLRTVCAKMKETKNTAIGFPSFPKEQRKRRKSYEDSASVLN